MSAHTTESYAHFGYSLRLLVVLLVIGSLILFASNLIAGQLFSFTSIGSRGDITKINVGVYWDVNCSSPVSFIEWGDIEPESEKNVSLFIRNEVTVERAATLFLSTDNWSPSNASAFMTLSWDYDGRTLARFEIVQVTLTLQVSPSVRGIGSFSFDIIIAAAAA